MKLAAVAVSKQRVTDGILLKIANVNGRSEWEDRCPLHCTNVFHLGSINTRT